MEWMPFMRILEVLLLLIEMGDIFCSRKFLPLPSLPEWGTKRNNSQTHVQNVSASPETAFRQRRDEQVRRALAQQQQQQQGHHHQPEPSARTKKSGSSSPDPVFVRRFSFYPAVPVRVDYVAKQIDLTKGPVWLGLLSGITGLKNSGLVFKEVFFSEEDNLSGKPMTLDALPAQVAEAWVADISTKQVPNILGGVGPMSSLTTFLNVSPLRSLVGVVREYF